MVRARLIAVAAICSSAMLMAQAPATPGRGAPPAGAPPAGPPPTSASPQNAPPASADSNLLTGQGRGGALFGKAHANITGANGLKGTADFYEIANSGNGHMMQVVLAIEGAPPGIHGVHIHAVGRCDGTTTPPFTSAGGHFDPGPAGDPNPRRARRRSGAGRCAGAGRIPALRRGWAGRERDRHWRAGAG